jgi:hypothetical protein
VWSDHAYRTSGGLVKSDLTISKCEGRQGKIVSRQKSDIAQAYERGIQTKNET